MALEAASLVALIPVIILDGIPVSRMGADPQPLLGTVAGLTYIPVTVARLT